MVHLLAKLMEEPRVMHSARGVGGPYLEAKGMDFLRGNVWIQPIWTIKKIEM